MLHELTNYSYKAGVSAAGNKPLLRAKGHGLFWTVGRKQILLQCVSKRRTYAPLVPKSKLLNEPFNGRLLCATVAS
jgi:hypothetical protein